VTGGDDWLGFLLPHCMNGHWIWGMDPPTTLHGTREASHPEKPRDMCSVVHLDGALEFCVA
jgi:hypothetical protein